MSGNLGGRPKKFKEEYIKAAQFYLDNYNNQDIGDTVPTVAGLALHIGVSKQSLYNWANDGMSEKFLDVFTRVQMTQEKKLVNGGLDGSFNPAITKMMMTKHGYSDKQEVDMSSKDGTMTPPTPTYVVVDE